jgi:Serine dehydrogenase proteinase
MGQEDRTGDGGPREHSEGEGGQAGVLPAAPSPSIAASSHASRTPLFNAQHAARYERQRLIRDYEAEHDCRLAVLIDTLFPDSVVVFEELVHDADPQQYLHLLLDTPGGDGETAIRIVRSAQARCRELTVIVPNQAKSAGTILLMGAHHILMGPTSDLGPVDPQFPTENGLYSAKDLIAAVEHAEQALATNPESYPLQVSLLADFSAVMVQQARSALGRSEDLVREALRSNPDRSDEVCNQLAAGLKEKLIDVPRDHGAVFSAGDAESVGLPVQHADPSGDQWRRIWELWAKYFALQCFVCEGRLASQTSPMGPYGF